MLNEKIIIISGGSGLIGKEFVSAIKYNGGIPVVFDIDQGDLSSEIDFYKVNITHKDEIEKTIKLVHEKYGRIDALVNNAYPRNKNYGRDLRDVEYSDFCENISLHLGGYFLMSQIFSAYFEKQGGGNIINMSSIYGVIPPKFEVYEGTSMTMPVEYASIKSSIVMLTKYFAKYFKNKNIRFNAISPGGVLNGQDPDFLKKYNEQCLSKGMIDKEDLTSALVFLLGDNSKMINGQNLIVDDGFSL